VRVSFQAAIFCAAVFICMGKAAVQAGEPDVLRVQFSTMAPWKMGSKGKERGVDIEFMQMLAERMNLRVEFVHMPFARGLACMDEGEIDLMTGVLYRPEREAFLYYITPPYSQFSPKAFYVLKGSDISIRSYEDLYDLRIGTTIGAKYFRAFDKDMRLQKEPVRSMDLNFKKLLDRRIDTVIASETSADRQIKVRGIAARITKAGYKYQRLNQVHMVLSKRSPLAVRLPEFNAHMKALLEKGVREHIKRNYAKFITH